MTNYQKNHKLAKFISYFLVISLLLINGQLNYILIDCLAVTIWFWGINPMGYVIETIRNQEHEHDQL